VASKVAPAATVNHPAALLWKLVSCARWVSVSCASMACCAPLYQRRFSTYMTGGTSHHHADGRACAVWTAAAFPWIPSRSTSSSLSSTDPW
jgi:hypothetical protein